MLSFDEIKIVVSQLSESEKRELIEVVHNSLKHESDYRKNLSPASLSDLPPSSHTKPFDKDQFAPFDWPEDEDIEDFLFGDLFGQVVERPAHRFLLRMLG